MNEECLQIFKRIAAKKKDGDSNLYLKVLSRIIKFKGSNYEKMDFTFFDNIENESIDPAFEIDNADIKKIDNDEDFKDLRLLTIKFQNFRTFPFNSKKYGLRVERNGNPCSTFLVGRNSTGKSTIFSAIEYFYAKKVSNAELKSIPKDEYKSYLSNNFEKDGDVHLHVKTKGDSREIDYKLEKIKRICMPAMFCSDNDIYEIGKQQDEILNQFILEQLGYTDLIIIRDRLTTIIDGVNKVPKEDKDKPSLDKNDWEDILNMYISYLSKKKENKEKAIESSLKYMIDENAKAILEDAKNPKFRKSKVIKQVFFKKDWKIIQTLILLSNVEGADTEIEDAVKKLAYKYKILNNLIDSDPLFAMDLFTETKKMYISWQKTQGVFSTMKDAFDGDLLFVLNQVVTHLNSEANGILKIFIQDYGKFIEDSLKYFSEDYETFKLDYQVGNMKMIIHVKKKGEKPFDTSPATYLNSFRFKLYAVALKLSLAFFYMKTNRRILPIAMDDVFNANDFDNSIHLQYFVHKIYELYHDKVSQTIPLQLIMLTHDEIILSAFQKGYNAKEIIKWNESKEEREKSQQKYFLYKDNCIIGRLFHYQEVKYINENKSNLEFYNLYNEINYYG